MKYDNIKYHLINTINEVTKEINSLDEFSQNQIIRYISGSFNFDFHLRFANWRIRYYFKERFYVNKIYAGIGKIRYEFINGNDFIFDCSCDDGRKRYS